MTEAAAEASESASVSGARTGDALAVGPSPVSAVFTKCSAMESEGGIAPGAWGQCRSSALLAARWGCAWARGRVERNGAERSETVESGAL